MTMELGSVAYWLYLAPSAGLLVGLTCLLKNCSDKTKRTVIFLIACLNLGQHLFKSVLYPHLWGRGFSYLNTAYNACAFLILVSPLVGFCRRESVKDFVYLTGTCAGLAAMVLPVWFLGKPAWGWEQGRFYICHSLLLCTSALPLTTGLHRLNWRSWYKIAPMFFRMLLIVLMDNVFCIYLDLVPGASPETLHSDLCRLNPFWIMGPGEDAAGIIRLLDPITPNVFLQGDRFVPILWYALPLCALFSVGALTVLVLADRRRFLADMRTLHQRLKDRWQARHAGP